jgi:hypothetical protein
MQHHATPKQHSWACCAHQCGLLRVRPRLLVQRLGVLGEHALKELFVPILHGALHTAAARVILLADVRAKVHQQLRHLLRVVYHRRVQRRHAGIVLPSHLRTTLCALPTPRLCHQT